MSTKLALSAAANLRRIVNDNYLRAHQGAAAGKFVVWAAIIVPLELLHGFDLVVCVPENHAAMCAARGVGAQQCQKAEAAGYSMDLCSYARIDLGTALAGGEGSPSMGQPRPNLLISDNNNCSLLVKWFDAVQRMSGAGHFVIDAPFCYQPQRPADTRYLEGQLRAMIRAIEGLTGQRCDMDKVGQAMAYSDQACALWKKLLSLAQSRPAGITAFDTFAHMAPYITSLRGTKELVDHLRLLVDEIELNMAMGKCPVPDERYRLLWDNIAPWHQLRAMSSRLAGLGANIVSATYTACLGSLEGRIDHYPYDGGDPLAYLARMQNFSVCPHGLELRAQAMAALIERYGVDGVIFGSNRSCKVYSVMQMDLQRLMAARCGAPAVMIELDHADGRKYSEEAAFLRIEALLEAIDAGRTMPAA
ncbi:2-hydroxyacyl-CoA dehydratase subunit D [Desulfarculus baarsii]